MTVQIRSRWDESRVLFVAEGATVREAVEAAVRADADLRVADLRGANLRDADLWDATTDDPAGLLTALGVRVVEKGAGDE